MAVCNYSAPVNTCTKRQYRVHACLYPPELALFRIEAENKQTNKRTPWVRVCLENLTSTSQGFRLLWNRKIPLPSSS
jgi:hypothetical protein